MSVAFEIRYATPDDVDAILDLFEEVASERLWLGIESGFDRERKRAQFLEAIAQPDTTPFWIASDGGAIAGTLSLFEHPNAGLAVGMLVRRSHRRRGIGTALMECSFAWCRERGVTALSLHVFPHNAAARALYTATGFREIERFDRDIRRQNGEVWDSILMRKEF